MIQEQDLGNHQIILKSSAITAPTGSSSFSSTNPTFVGSPEAWPSGPTADVVRVSYNNPRGTRNSQGSETVWRRLDLRQFVEPALPFDSYDIELSLIDLSVQADQFASRNLIVGTALEVYMDSPGNTNSVVYDSGTRFENAEVRRAALMSYIVAAGSVYTERTVADGTLLTRVKPTLKLRVRPEGLVLDIRVVLKPQMGHNPGTPNWADGVEVGPMLLALNAHVVGRFVAPAYA